jgi:hypothetical protein
MGWIFSDVFTLEIHPAAISSNESSYEVKNSGFTSAIRANERADFTLG